PYGGTGQPCRLGHVADSSSSDGAGFHRGPEAACAFIQERAQDGKLRCDSLCDGVLHRAKHTTLIGEMAKLFWRASLGIDGDLQGAVDFHTTESHAEMGQGKLLGNQRVELQPSRGDQCQRLPNGLRRMMKATDELAFPVMQRLGLEAYRGAGFTAAEEDGMATLTDEPHGQFPELRPSHRLDSHLNALPVRRQAAD